MEASSFTPSVYSVHALTLLAEVNIECHAHLFALHLHNQCNKTVSSDAPERKLWILLDAFNKVECCIVIKHREFNI